MSFWGVVVEKSPGHLGGISGEGIVGEERGSGQWPPGALHWIWFPQLIIAVATGSEATADISLLSWSWISGQVG